MQIIKRRKTLLFLGLVIFISILFKQFLLFTQVKGFLQGDPYEYASMAYRVVFNNSWESWDIRSWFYSFFLMIPLVIMKWLDVLPGPLFMRLTIEVQIIFSTFCLLLVYLIGKKINNTFTGIVSVFFLSLNTLFNRWSLSTTTDVPATLFYLIALYLSIPDANKKNTRSFTAGLFMGISFGIRYQSIFLLIPLCLFYLKRLKHFLYFFSGLIIIFLLIGTVDQFIYGNLFHSFIEYFKYNLYVLPTKILNINILQGNTFYLNSFIFYFSIFEIILLIISVVTSIYKKSVFNIILSIFFTFIIYSVLSLKEDRFLVMTIPLMCILSAIGLDFIKLQIIRIFKLPLISLFFIGFILIFISFFHINKIKYMDLQPFGGIIDGINNLLKNDNKPRIVAPLYTVGKEFYFGENLKVINLDSTDWKNKSLVRSALKEGEYYFAWNINSFEFKRNVVFFLRKNNYYIFHQYNKLEVIGDADNNIINDHYVNKIYLFKK